MNDIEYLRERSVSTGDPRLAEIADYLEADQWEREELILEAGFLTGIERRCCLMCIYNAAWQRDWTPEAREQYLDRQQRWIHGDGVTEKPVDVVSEVL